MNWADPTPARVERVAKMLRYQDRLEVLYSDSMTGEEAVYSSWQSSSICRCIDGDDGEAVGICGVNGSRIWLLATDELLATASHRRQFIRGGRQWVNELVADGHQLLENWALASNLVTLRWLKHLGFTIDTAAPLGRSCQLFCHFWRAA
jgi:hypothetical protein